MHGHSVNCDRRLVAPHSGGIGIRAKERVSTLGDLSGDMER